MTKGETIYDVIVIGGGPAGMMAAGRAAENGARVLLLEKNDSLGKKLLITGGGRCNVTNAEYDSRKFLDKFRDNAKFLFSAFSQFAVPDALQFFHDRNMPTKIEAEGRVFPESNTAESVWNVLVEYLKQGKVTVRSNTAVNGFEVTDGKIVGVKLSDGEILTARSYVLATGGKSRPETGSTGDGFKWLKALGHTVIESNAALVPLSIKDPWIRRLAGVSLKDIKLTTFQNEQKQDTRKGKMLFTHVGISGPLVLNMSKDIGELLKYGEVVISLDLFPNMDPGALDKKLLETFSDNQNKLFKNALSGLVTGALAPVIIEQSGIDPEKQVNSINREERLAFGRLLKGIQMTVKGLLGVEKAIVTSGGVALSEVDFKTMQSKLHPNLYLVGDILNIDRPSGGYSLQLCWTTGYVAGTNLAR